MIAIDPIDAVNVLALKAPQWEIRVVQEVKTGRFATNNDAVLHDLDSAELRCVSARAREIGRSPASWADRGGAERPMRLGRTPMTDRPGQKRSDEEPDRLACELFTDVRGESSEAKADQALKSAGEVVREVIPWIPKRPPTS